MKEIKPYDEHLDIDIFWKEDPFDKHLPKQKGFITDFIYALRGTEAPTAYCVWSALFALATIIKREAWLEWYPQRIYPNLFIILVGPAGVVKKSTSISFADSILKHVERHIEDPNDRHIKTPSIVRNKSTPEAILEAMRIETPKYVFRSLDGRPVTDSDGNLRTYSNTSEVSIVVSELAVMIGKQRYNESMVDLLLDLYDPHEVFEYRTVGKGPIKLRRLCTSIIGATTPDGFANSIPRQATGDGFLSRTIVIAQKSTKRRFPQPRRPKGAPDNDELSKRLAHIAVNTVGAFTFSEAAFKAYENWYFLFKDRLEVDPDQGVKSRQDITLMKLSMLMCAQRYDNVDNIITIDDFHDALRLLKGTYLTSPALISDVKGDTIMRWVTKVRHYLIGRGRVRRDQMLRNMHMQTSVATAALEQLLDEGDIAVYRNDNRCGVVSRKSDEEYEYIGDVEE